MPGCHMRVSSRMVVELAAPSAKLDTKSGSHFGDFDHSSSARSHQGKVSRSSSKLQVQLQIRRKNQRKPDEGEVHQQC